ncbi:MAG: DUF6941 family protein [Gemmatimonadota bacterium]
MQVTLALLADYANVTREGKLNLLGIFDRIDTLTLPAIHRELQLIIRLEAQYVEAGRPHTVEVKLHEPDGPEVFSIGGELEISAREPGEVIANNHIITIGNLLLKRFGVYQFAIFVDNDLKHQIPLRVQQINPEQPRLPGT